MGRATLLVAVDGNQEDLEGHRGRRHVFVWVLAIGRNGCCGEREFDVILGIGIETAVQ